MALQSLTLFCHRCTRETGHTRRTTSHGLHFLLTLFTLGFWLPAWIAITVLGLRAAQCGRCGSSYDQPLAVKTAMALDDKLGRSGAS